MFILHCQRNFGKISIAVKSELTITNKDLQAPLIRPAKSLVT